MFYVWCHRAQGGEQHPSTNPKPLVSSVPLKVRILLVFLLLLFLVSCHTRREADADEAFLAFLCRSRSLSTTRPS